MVYFRCIQLCEENKYLFANMFYQLDAALPHCIFMSTSTECFHSCPGAYLGLCCQTCPHNITKAFFSVKL